MLLVGGWGYSRGSLFGARRGNPSLPPEDFRHEVLLDEAWLLQSWINKPVEEQRRMVVLSEASGLFFEQAKQAPAASLTFFIGSGSPWVAAVGTFVHPAVSMEPDMLRGSADICGIRKVSRE